MTGYHEIDTSDRNSLRKRLSRTLSGKFETIGQAHLSPLRGLSIEAESHPHSHRHPIAFRRYNSHSELIIDNALYARDIHSQDDDIHRILLEQEILSVLKQFHTLFNTESNSVGINPLLNAKKNSLNALASLSLIAHYYETSFLAKAGTDLLALNLGLDNFNIEEIIIQHIEALYSRDPHHSWLSLVITDMCLMIVFPDNQLLYLQRVTNRMISAFKNFEKNKIIKETARCSRYMSEISNKITKDNLHILQANAKKVLKACLKEQKASRLIKQELLNKLHAAISPKNAYPEVTYSKDAYQQATDYGFEGIASPSAMQPKKKRTFCTIL